MDNKKFGLGNGTIPDKDAPKGKQMGGKRPGRKDAAEASRAGKVIQEAFSIPHEISLGYAKVFGTHVIPVIGMTEVKGNIITDESQLFRGRLNNVKKDPDKQYTTFGEEIPEHIEHKEGQTYEEE